VAAFGPVDILVSQPKRARNARESRIKVEIFMFFEIRKYLQLADMLFGKARRVHGVGLVGLGLELQTRGVPEHQQRPPLPWWCPQSHVRLIRGPAGGALRPRFDLAGSLPADEPGMHVWLKIPVGRPAEAPVTGKEDPDELHRKR
jgi:hypothetical protein